MCSVCNYVCSCLLAVESEDQGVPTIACGTRLMSAPQTSSSLAVSRGCKVSFEVTHSK